MFLFVLLQVSGLFVSVWWKGLEFMFCRKLLVFVFEMCIMFLGVLIGGVGGVRFRQCVVYVEIILVVYLVFLFWLMRWLVLFNVIKFLGCLVVRKIVDVFLIFMMLFSGVCIISSVFFMLVIRGLRFCVLIFCIKFLWILKGCLLRLICVLFFLVILFNVLLKLCVIWVGLKGVLSVIIVFMFVSLFVVCRMVVLLREWFIRRFGVMLCFVRQFVVVFRFCILLVKCVFVNLFLECLSLVKLNCRIVMFMVVNCFVIWCVVGMFLEQVK